MKEPFPKISANVSLVTLFGLGFTQLETLRIRLLERGDKVTLSRKAGDARSR